MKYILWILLAFIVLGIISIGIRKNKSSTLKINSTHIAQETEDLFLFPETMFDFGVVKQSGGLVEHKFPFTYMGTEKRTITDLPTSCGCTSAKVFPSELLQGTEGIVTVMFDPNLHSEPEGKFYKTVTLLTDPELKEMPELKIWAKIDMDLGPEFLTQETHIGEVLLDTENLAPEKAYRTISASTLKEALEDKHFFLVDVHTPEQEHIEGTDAVIPYNELTTHINNLPENKSERVVVYCRGGNMSQEAAQTLINLGYTNVYHVEGGKNAYNLLDE